MNTYDVRLWNILTNKGTRRSTYTVRWFVSGAPFRKTFITKALAESYRSKLVIAQREGVAFDEATGLPEPMARELKTRTWLEHAIAFADMKWPHASPNHRKSIAEALTTVTLALLRTDRGTPKDKTMRAALFGWTFNKTKRDDSDPPEDIAKALRWLRDNTSLSALSDAATVRKVLDFASRPARRISGSSDDHCTKACSILRNTQVRG